ncbi:MAG: T9SS type A sorting domain-containing protein [Bacteroidota bacterium]|nr:T9SS type A sorting domain-containing protein [Bacteroidota bacterium]
MNRLFLTAILFLCINSAFSQLAGLTITGTPTSTNGATWTYQATVGSVTYDLKGILYAPIGTGKFPSVIVNHGSGGNTNPGGYSDNLCKQMVTWGYVCIAVNLTQSGGGVPCGSPGNCYTTNWGASNDNFLRAMKCWDILASLAYTDTNCIAAFGHSRGAMLTTGLLGTFPNKFSCAGHTAGGVGHPTDLTYPTYTMVNNINKPYILHHGTIDPIVNIIYDDKIDSIFTVNSVTHQYYTYAGYDHGTMSQDTLMFSRTKAFFNQHICNSTTGLNNNKFAKQTISIYPNPSSNCIQTNLDATFDFQIFDITGELLFSKTVLPKEKIDVSSLPTGIYTCRIKIENETSNQKITIIK